MPEDLAALPGGELVVEGLEDVRQGKESPAALLLAIGEPRLRRLGIPLPPAEEMAAEPELRLYRLLSAMLGKGAYSRYNSLVRELVSFERALERQRGRTHRLGR